MVSILTNITRRLHTSSKFEVTWRGRAWQWLAVAAMEGQQHIACIFITSLDSTLTMLSSAQIVDYEEEKKRRR